MRRQSQLLRTDAQDGCSPMRAVRRLRHAGRLVAAVALACLGVLAVPATSQAAGSDPCDIYAAAGTPCVAAYSTVRALYAAYDGPLYQIKRASDTTSANVGLLSAGGCGNSTERTSSAPTPTA